MGYVEKKLTTVLKGPLSISLKQRFEARRCVNGIIRMRRLLDAIQKEVRQKHNIAKALKLQDRVEELARRIIENGFLLGFNAEMGMEKALAKIKAIIEDWEKADRAGKLSRELKAQDADFERKMWGEVVQGEKRQRELYFRSLEVMIRLGESKGDNSTMMANIALLFKQKEGVSRFAKFAFRGEARGERRGIVGLGKDESKIKGYLESLGHKKVDAKKVLRNLAMWDGKAIADAEEGFRESYLLWKRDFLLNIILLHLLQEHVVMMRQFISERLMPMAAEEKNISDIQEIRRKLAQNGHILAQGFRIIIAKEKGIEGSAQRELGRAAA